jgi:hypothetical protein
MARPPVFSKNDVKRLIQVARSEGLPVTAIHIGPDGSISVKTEAMSGETPDSALDEWVAKHAHETEGN